MFRKNVYLLKPNDLSFGPNNEVFTPNWGELAVLRNKSEQFKRDVEFRENMSDHDVRRQLEMAFPVLRNTEFSCAVRAQNSASLDFNGAPHVWNGFTISRALRSGGSVLYIVMKDAGLSTTARADTESGMSDSGRSSEESLYRPYQLHQRPRTPLEGTTVTIYRDRGPVEGKEPFLLTISDNRVSESEQFLLVEFGANGKRVGRCPDSKNMWQGLTPPSPVIGEVVVTVKTLNGNEVGKTFYTYYLDEDEEAMARVVNSERLQWDCFNEFKNQQGASQGSGENRVSKQGGVKNSVNVLRRLVFTAARIGAEQFIRLIFGTSAGHTVYETYKNESIFPEDIATSNGHHHIAAYLETQSKKFSQENSTSQTQSQDVNWQELLNAIEDSEVQSSDPETEEIGVDKDNISETMYFGDTEDLSDCDKERPGNTDVKEEETILEKSGPVYKLPDVRVEPWSLKLIHDNAQVPLDILTRGPLALKAYKEALARGETSVRRVPVMLIGQGGAGKTSTKKSLKGICFDPNEDTTDGIDVDPSYFKVSTETWRTGEQGQDQNSDTAVYLDYHLARCIADSLKTQENSIQWNPDRDSPDSEIVEVPEQPITTEESRDKDQKEEAAVAKWLSRGDLNDDSLSLTTVPEEAAAVTERFPLGDVDDNREDIYFTFWDFTGQSVYYVTYPLTARAMFLLVYGLSLNPDDEAKPVLKQGVNEESEEGYNLKTNFDYLDFWMRSVASLARGQSEGSRLEETTSVKLPPVFLVCTHADKPYGHGDPEKLARTIFGYLKRKPYGAHLCDVFLINNTSLSVNNSDCPQIVRLREEIIAVAKELPFINETIPINWLKFEKALQAKKEMGNKSISLESAKDIAKQDCNIVDEKEFETLLNHLHDIRSLIHYEDSVQLNKLVVLDLPWLVDVFKKVITVKPYDPKEKEFLHLWRRLESTGVLDENLVAHVWGPLFDRETLESLIGIMERFSLLCPWSVHASSNRQYLVPSMLMSCPTTELLELVESANIPSLFVRFSNGEVPTAFFPRLVVQFIQWGRERFWSEETPQLFTGFARFFTSEEKCSVIFICHSSSVEVVVHGGNSSPFLPSSGEETCARRVRRQLSLILECMRNQFSWLENMKYEMCVKCPVCSNGREVVFCQTHGAKRCKQEECLHFWRVSELCSDTRTISCRRFAVSRDTTVEIRQFSPWFPAQEEQLGNNECDGDPFALDEGNQEKTLAVCSSVLEHLSSQSCDAKLVVSQLKETIQLDQASLEQPDSDTKKRIRFLARAANRCGRRDVVEHLKEITPAGTTAPLLPESLDVRRIPFSQARQLTIALTVAGGDKWKLVAEKLGLNHEEIRFLDERNTNPVDALLGFIANQRYMSVGELYQVLCDCGIPVIADKL